MTECFNTQPPEGGCLTHNIDSSMEALFQHTAARRRLPDVQIIFCNRPRFNTQPPEGGCLRINGGTNGIDVSTHSRPKAAA